MRTHDDDLAELFEAAYAELIAAAPEAPTFDALVDPAVNLVPREPDDDAFDIELRGSERSGRGTPFARPILVAAAAAAAVVAAAGLVVATRDGEHHESAADPVPTANTATLPAEPDLAMARQSIQALAGSTADFPESVRVVAGGPGFVAVGGADGNAAVWTSVDGAAWSQVPHDEAVFGGDGEVWMSAVTAGGPGLVAVGQHEICTDIDAPGEEDPVGVCVHRAAAVWTSTDGITWSRVPHDEAVFGGPGFTVMNDVTAGGPGLVAVGQAQDFGGAEAFVERGEIDGDAAVWTSVDGLTWSRVPHDRSVFGGAKVQDMAAVTVGGPGLVAVGREGSGVCWCNSVDERPAVWTSADGRRWSRVPEGHNDFGINSAMLGVTRWGPDLVAVGHGNRYVARVWTSTDGVTWTRASGEDGQEMEGTMFHIASVSDGLVATGYHEDGTIGWTSPDGRSWSRLLAEPELPGSP